MKIIVAGCGKIGLAVLASLVSEEHDVTVIDNDLSVVSNATDIYDAIGVCGNCVDCEILTEAGAEKTDLFIATTGSDELNMLSCFLAKKMGTKHTVAKISNPDYNDSRLGFVQKQLDISLTVNPELLAAKEISAVLRLPTAAKIETFSGRSFEIAELWLKQDSPLDGLSLIELRKKYRASFLICVVQRGDDVYIPDGNFVLKSGDKIALTATPNELQKLLKMLGIMQKQARDVMIIGASRTAYYLSKILLSAGNTVKIIDINREKLEQFSDLLPSIDTAYGDGSEQELLLEEGLLSVDAFVTLTGIDEENMLLSCFASSQNVPKVISKVNRPEFAAMAEKLGLDCLVSPKKSLSDIVVSYARALQNSEGSNVETLYKIMDDKAEALEFSVLPDCTAAGKPLKELHIKKNILIAGILRQRKTIIPSGDDMILPGDKVIVIAAGKRLGDLSDIIE